VSDEKRVAESQSSGETRAFNTVMTGRKWAKAKYHFTSPVNAFYERGCQEKQFGDDRTTIGYWQYSKVPSARDKASVHLK
jgi:hypothetical protein